MINPQVLQAAVISLLKAQSTITAEVGTEIKEDQWEGTEFRYPCLRVSLLTLSPHSNGECRPTIADVAMTVLCFVEGTSSRGAARLAGIVANAIFGKRLKTSEITPVTRINIPDNGVAMPVPEGERLWRAEVQFTATVKEA